MTVQKGNIKRIDLKWHINSNSLISLEVTILSYFEREKIIKRKKNSTALQYFQKPAGTPAFLGSLTATSFPM